MFRQISGLLLQGFVQGNGSLRYSEDGSCLRHLLSHQAEISMVDWFLVIAVGVWCIDLDPCLGQGLAVDSSVVADDEVDVGVQDALGGDARPSTQSCGTTLHLGQGHEFGCGVDVVTGGVDLSGAHSHLVQQVEHGQCGCIGVTENEDPFRCLGEGELLGAAHHCCRIGGRLCRGGRRTRLGIVLVCRRGTAGEAQCAREGEGEAGNEWVGFHGASCGAVDAVVVQRLEWSAAVLSRGSKRSRGCPAWSMRCTCTP